MEGILYLLFAIMCDSIVSGAHMYVIESVTYFMAGGTRLTKSRLTKSLCTLCPNCRVLSNFSNFSNLVFVSLVGVSLVPPGYEK